MKTIYKKQNCTAMTREGVLAIIYGVVLVVFLILHFRKKENPVPSSSGVSNNITADAITITEPIPASTNVVVEAIGFESTNENPKQLVVTNAATAPKDISSSTAEPTQMRLPPAQKQRIQVPPNARWVPTNMGRPSGPGVPIAFP